MIDIKCEFHQIIKSIKLNPEIDLHIGAWNFEYSNNCKA